MGKSDQQAAPEGEAAPLESIDRILEATISCFSRYGYDRASIKLIAEEAGVSRGLLHYHFASKEELFVAAVGRMGERIYNEIRRRGRQGEAPLTRLTSAANELYELLIKDPALANFMLELVGTANHNEALRAHYIAQRDRQRAFMREVIEEAVGEAAGKSPLPLDQMVQMLETWVMGLIVQRSFHEGDEETRRIYNAFLVLTGRMLSKK